MADSKISALTHLNAVPASGDMIPLVDVSDTTQAASGTTKRLAASFFAFVGAANTFTAAQTIQPSSTGVAGLTVNMPTSTSGNALNVDYNSESRLQYAARAAFNQFNLLSFDNGAGISAQYIAGRNSNASTPAPGCFRAVRSTGSTTDCLYPDNSGIWRTLTSSVVNSTIASGDVVGAQSSHIKYKKIVGEPVSEAQALANILAAAEQVREFEYLDGRFNGQRFSGIILDGDELHRYGMDADADHRAGKALNEINAIGDLMLAVKALAQRVAALENA